MPELPEVETVRLGLARLLPGRAVAVVTHDWPKSFPNAAADVGQFLIGAEVAGVRRRAKVLLIDLSTQHTLVIHLKMTGQLVFVMHGENRELRIENRGKSEKNNILDSHLHGNDAVSKSDSLSRVIPAQAGIQSNTNSISPNSQFFTPNSSKAALRFGAGHPNDSLVGNLPDKTTRVIFEFKDGSHLYFNDQRKFGWVRLLPTVEVENLDFFKKVGPEPLSADFTWQEFQGRFQRRKKSSIKAALLDQTVVAGVGNIYADESLWGAKIHPSAPVGDVTDAQFRQLFTALRDVLQLSIEKGGSTDKNYVNAEGQKGSYLSFANVFRREGHPCPRCGTTIIKTRVATRGTHLCPNCQQLT